MGYNDNNVDYWQDNKHLTSDFPERYAFVSRFIPSGSTVFDIGCGAMHLEKHLPWQVAYQPCDLYSRDDRTIVIDLNQQQFPDVSKADLLVFISVIEYLSDPIFIIQKIKESNKAALIIYPINPLTDSRSESEPAYPKHLTESMWQNYLKEYGLYIYHQERIGNDEVLFYIKPVEVFDDVRPDSYRHIDAKKKVLVLSYYNIGNFGDRIGYHMINQVLPPQVNVSFGHFMPWTVPDGEYDLVIIGFGNSLYRPMCTDALLNLVKDSKHAIGIFGTQFRKSLDTDYVNRLINELDVWFARFLEDKRLYGKNNEKVIHFGDWFTRAFPLSSPTILDAPLKLGKEVFYEIPLDRMIQHILKYAYVSSPGIHPLLCAFSGAKEVSYREVKDRTGKLGGEKTGKFRSMFIDIFGRQIMEGEIFKVERDKLIQYRMFVDNNVIKLRNAIIRLLS